MCYVQAEGLCPCSSVAVQTAGSLCWLVYAAPFPASVSSSMYVCSVYGAVLDAV